MQKNKQFENYENTVIDIDEITNTDIKINPDYYIHTAILKAQNALVKDNVRDGFVQYRVIIEHIETLCSAAKMLDDNYDKEVLEYGKELDIKEKDKLNKMVKIATFKLKLIMSSVFRSKTLTAPMKA